MHVTSLSYGGGWQSVALCVLIGKKVLTRPDIAGIADTSREVATTWQYMHEHMQPYLDRTCGLKIEIVPHTLSRVDLYAADGSPLAPAYTRNVESFDGMFGQEDNISEGRLPAFCSGEWKRDTMERWYRLKGARTVEQWIGFSLDEKSRMKKDHRPWCHNTFPLIDLGITRKMCAEIIASAGLPMPKKSRCFMCPHQTAQEWQEVFGRPEEFAAAVHLEKEMNEMDPEQSGELFFYSGRIPLELANFATDAGIAAPMKPCEGGNCWT